jgi:hypothetical protein
VARRPGWHAPAQNVEMTTKMMTRHYPSIPYESDDEAMSHSNEKVWARGTVWFVDLDDYMTRFRPLD